jgi:hypothetical protein
LVAVVRVSPVSTFRRVSEALATTPPAFDLTVPRMAPEVVLVWACATTVQARADRRRTLALRMDIKTPCPSGANHGSAGTVPGKMKGPFQLQEIRKWEK